jgi:hypothetical protein
VIDPCLRESCCLTCGHAGRDPNSKPGNAAGRTV